MTFTSSEPSSSHPSTLTYSTHPITRMMDEAEERFRAKVERQSKTLPEAIEEYKRRYGMPPPKGFDGWWEYTRKYDVVLVDEYDTLMRDLAPHGWALGGGPEMRRRIAEVAGVSSIDLVRVRNGVPSTVSINKDGFVDDEVSARARGLKSMLGKCVAVLPDMDFPVNAKAEGRVIVPWDRWEVADDIPNDDKNKVHPLSTFRPDWRGEGNVWDTWRRTCPPNSTARKFYASIRILLSYNYLSHLFLCLCIASSFAFAPSTSFDSVSFCDSPHLHYTQGHFFSDWRTLGDLYPILSPARAKGFGDIKIPSHYYYGSTDAYTYGWDEVNLELQPTDRGETGKESKRNKIFWRGATTGGGNSPPGFAALYQRHRAVRMTGPFSNISLSTSAESSVSQIQLADVPLTAHKIPAATLNKALMDIAFVKAANADQYPGGMEKLMQEHRFSGSVYLGGHWQYKYLIDLDGMSYSGRFMSFLASDSVPIKSTVYEEFFSEWIEPWLHYIPLSSSYEEIYNIYGYFSGIPAEVVEEVYGNATDPATGAPLFPPGTKIPAIPGAPDGDARLRRIARAGKQWKRTIGRTLDLESYVYRLALEWARLCADDRDAMTMKV
ncbi:capsular associated protein [Lentinula aff. lateritia]|uniref:Capsular associated protein n=1 Tax=Lentinula aff. lateritia TaxID=2804960 RepID=A0ACC1U0G7_9AGAR|nr:capsular associated protein [Lentinula aff. lateritia]